MGVRIDKFVWFVRLAKTRSIATEQVKKGKVKLNGEGIKPAREVKIGDTVQIIKHSATFSFKIKDLLNNRVGAKLVENYIVDTTAPEELEKFKLYQASQRVYRDYGTGKPSKKDRRDLEDYLDWD
ncbi:MAG: RNA-binding S4 domain-containing protein [Lishizhenia sp.]